MEGLWLLILVEFLIWYLCVRENNVSYVDEVGKVDKRWMRDKFM